MAILNICSEDELGDQETAALDMSDGEDFIITIKTRSFTSGFWSFFLE